MVTVEYLPGILFKWMFSYDERFVLTGGLDMTSGRVELGLAHPVGIVRMQFV
jgi:hypothetical protein